MRLTKSALAVRLTGLSLPDGWRARLDQHKVERHREKLRRGVVPPPIRLTPAREVVYGFHRIAAAMDESAESIRADIVEYASKAEQEADMLGENLDRLVFTKAEERALLARLVRLEVEMATAKVDAEEDAGEVFPQSADQPQTKGKEANKGGRPKSAERQAIKKVAKQRKRSEDTVERAVREAEAPRDEAPPPPEPVIIPPCLDWFDLPPDGDVEGAARKVQAQVDEADKKLRELRRLLTGLRELGLPNSACDDNEAAYEKLAHLIRRSRPKTACHGCKGGPTRANCFDCSGTGYATTDKAESSVHSELKKRGVEAMVRDRAGGFRPVAGPSLAQSPRTGLGGKKLRLEDPEGNPIVPPDEEPPLPEFSEPADENF